MSVTVLRTRNPGTVGGMLSFGYFDITVPGGYTPGSSFTVNYQAWSSANSTDPDLLTALAMTVNGGPLTNATTGNPGVVGFRSGQSVVPYITQQANPTVMTLTNFNSVYPTSACFNVAYAAMSTTLATRSVTVPGHNLDSGQTACIGNPGPSALNNVGGATLIDGTYSQGGAIGVSTQGFVASLSGTPSLYNFGSTSGWPTYRTGGAVGIASYPGLGGITSNTITFGPGDVISIPFSGYNTLPSVTRIAAITVTIGGTTINVPLTSVYNSPPFNSTTPAQHVSFGDPDSGNLFYLDFANLPASPQHGQGYIF